MYSPKRNEPTIERNDVVSSPLRALTPIVDVIKTAQTNASRDFDRFYDNLWAKLTPRTNSSRIRKRIPETTERMQSMLQERRDSEMDYASRTSLTPLIERHTLREDSRARYEDTNRNPFYQNSESDIADIPGLVERGAESSCSFTSHTPVISIAAPDSPSRRSMVFQHNRSHINNNATSSPRCSVLSSTTSSIMNQRFEEERKKMDKLQESVTYIRRQSSLLAEKSSRMASFLFDDDEEEEEEEIDIEPELSIPSSSWNQPLRTQRTPQQHHLQTSYQLATPPYSIDYNNRSKAPSSRTPRYSFHSSNNYNNKTTASPSKRTRSPSRHHISPAAKRVATSPSVRRTATSPRRNHHSNKNNGLIVSPKRIIIEDLPSAKLRSTEIITTPGGTMVSNRFWKEIHGLNGSKSPISSPTTPITKRISTLQEKAASSAAPKSTSQTWANDDQFWSSESSPAPSSFNNKLLQVARQEQNQKKLERERTEDDMHWTTEPPVTSSFSHRIFNTTPQRGVGLDDEEEEEEPWPSSSIVRDRSVSPVPSLFKNKLFKAAQEEKKQSEPSSSKEDNSNTRLSFSDRLLQLAQHDAASSPTTFNDKLMRLAEQEDIEQEQLHRHHHRQIGDSLSDELESAKKRDEIIKRNNIPIMNPALLAELKAKHHHATLIDDSDSYKFT